MKRLNPKEKSGFTLVETMIVVCVIGILITVAVPNYLRARKETSAKLCVINLRQIDTAKDRWAWSSDVNIGADVYMTDIVPGFIKTEPACPSNGIYTLGVIGELPTCSLGTNETDDLFDDHEIPQ